MKRHPDTRILALEVRYRRFGFAALEAHPVRLLDLGTRTFTSAGILLQRLGPIISTSDPCMIVVKQPIHRQISHQNGARANVQCIHAEAERRSIRIELLTISEIRDLFQKHEATKDAMAMKIAQTFPELRWKLPPRRKPWISEGHNMVIFDATATGLAYLARSEGKGTVP